MSVTEGSRVVPWNAWIAAPHAYTPAVAPPRLALNRTRCVKPLGKLGIAAASPIAYVMLPSGALAVFCGTILWWSSVLQTSVVPLLLPGSVDTTGPQSRQPAVGTPSAASPRAAAVVLMTPPRHDSVSSAGARAAPGASGSPGWTRS